jgi:hypothetical protein
VSNAAIKPKNVNIPGLGKVVGGLQKPGAKNV